MQMKSTSNFQLQ